ncbi:MAG TPA: hypothetical protein VFM05_11800, partial [Candidatus Saccharimonadales bacterium]|nr:hypothetical protein [Candidatus Saccharimonadales bacterium]
RGITDAQPSALRADFKDQYRSVVAAAYAATGNLTRAQVRLALLGDSDLAEALNAQAQRMKASSASGASGEQFENPDLVVALALALSEDTNGSPISTPTLEVVSQVEDTLTATSPPIASEEPFILTETPAAIETQTTVSAPTPRPTQTSVPTLSAPFELTGQESICDSNLPDGLLQVVVLNRNRRQVAGVEIVITWDGGKEQFFTGLKPELGNGYADYIMTPNTTYTVQLAPGSDVALGITAPTCQTASGENFFGGIKLTFQQP